MSQHQQGGWIVDAARRLAGWRSLWTTGEGHVLIVTSNGAARFALQSDPGLAAQARDLPSLKLRTGAFGVIERQADPSDRRALRIVLTEAGFALADRIVVSHVATEERLVSALSGEERAELRRLLAKIGQAQP